MKIYKGAG